jgi:uncharacterized protein (DUF1015 family)
LATIRPFSGIHYANRPDLELSKLIAPPYDVLKDADKNALQAKHPNNIVTVDLPHLPPESLGPDADYEKANTTLQAWLAAGVLVRDRRQALYPYTQSFEHHGKVFHRRGFIALVKLEPFGSGHVFPHEKTHKGPIQDRLKLMSVTGMQLSPIFGLFNDDRGEVTRMLYQNASRPMLDGTMDGVRNQLWSVTDGNVENEVIRMMGTKNIYIADGHHRYTTALQYQQDIQKQHNGALPPNHPANYCMFVLVNMYDDGLLILPTHRLIGGIGTFDIAQFKTIVGSNFDITETAHTPEQISAFADSINGGDPHSFGLYDGASRKTYKLRLINLDILKSLEPDRSDAWRSLDVAILQRYLLEEVLQKFASKTELTKGYTADASQVARLVDGKTYQLGLLLRSTPLPALEDLGRHGEVMPQKSTFFYPKLATGMMINPLK